MHRLIPVRPPPASVRAAATGGAAATTSSSGNGAGADGADASNNANAQKNPQHPPPSSTMIIPANTVVVDYYGFELHGLTPQQRADREAAAVRAARRAERWAPHALAGVLPSPPAALRRFCRKGVPPELRGWVWFESSGARRRAELAGPGAFARLAALAEETQPGAAGQIDLDLPRTFPRNASFASAQGQGALRRVLLASAARRPQQGYCQGLNFVAATLLLAVEGSTGDPVTAGSLDACAERAFWLLDALVGDSPAAAAAVGGGRGGAATTATTAGGGILYPGTFAPALEGCHVEMRAFGALLSKKMPRLARRLSAVGCDVSLLATDWFLCLFSTALPSETTARLLDALFADGHPKVLYRAALALMRRGERQLMAAEHPGEVLRAFRAGAARAHDRDALMRECWSRGGVGRLPLADICALREAARPGVEAMAAERQRRAKGGKGALRDAIEQGRKAQAQAAAAQAAGGTGGGGGGLGFSVLGGGGGGGGNAAPAADGAAMAMAAGRAPSPQQQQQQQQQQQGPAGGRLTPLLPFQEEQRRQQQLAAGGEEEQWGASAWADDSERFVRLGSGRR